METEIWKALPGVPGVEVSQLGNVRTLDRVVSSVRRTYLKKGRVLKQHERANGYMQVCFRINGKAVCKRVHRLVSETFIANPEGLPQVNHKDGNRANNNVSNLEWCNHSYNTQYREKFGKAQNRPVFAIDLSTLEVSYFCSQHEASRELGVFQQHISSVISGRYKQTGGYWFVNADGSAVDIVKQNLHDVGKTGLKLNA